MRELIARLIDSGKAFAQAEIALVRLTALRWANAAKFGAVFVLLALLLANAAVIVLVAALGMALATWLGVAGGLAAGAIIALAVAGLFGWLAMRRFANVAK